MAKRKYTDGRPEEKRFYKHGENILYIERVDVSVDRMHGNRHESVYYRSDEDSFKKERSAAFGGLRNPLPKSEVIKYLRATRKKADFIESKLAQKDSTI